METRGGFNRRQKNTDFFKSWSPRMAYILGFIYADGALIDARKSSRAQYISLTNTSKVLLEQIKLAIPCENIIYTRPARTTSFSNGSYQCKTTYNLRIGSREMFNDLINLGLSTRKALRLKLPPRLPGKFLSHFLRGYFDGDGCVNLIKPKNGHKMNIQVIFTSGCRSFLENLGKLLHKSLQIASTAVIKNGGGYRLRYRQNSSLNILSYMYGDLDSAPYLVRKYSIYQNFISQLI